MRTEYRAHLELAAGAQSRAPIIGRTALQPAPIRARAARPSILRQLARLIGR